MGTDGMQAASARRLKARRTLSARAVAMEFLMDNLHLSRWRELAWREFITTDCQIANERIAVGDIGTRRRPWSRLTPSSLSGTIGADEPARRRARRFRGLATCPS